MRNLDRLCTAAAIVMMAISASPLRAQTTYPTRMITIVVGFAPGGFMDSLARQVGNKLSQRVGQSVIIENRPGAGGNIAARVVLNLPHDGYTIHAASTSIAINESLYKSKGYSAKDFTAISIAASNPEVLAIHPSRPERTLKEFVETARAKDAAISFSTAGAGSGSHIAAEYFFREIAKIKAQHIPYQGGAPALTAAIGQHVDIVATALAAGLVEPINSNILRGLGVASDKRSTVIPDVPTYAESGFPFTATAWGGFFVAADTDPAIVVRLNSLIDDIMKDPDVVANMRSIGFEPVYGSQPEAEKLFRSEVDKWSKMVTALGLSVN